MKKYKRKGSLGQTESGELVLVNDAGKPFAVGDLVVVVWEKCDGENTSEQLAAFVGEIAEVDMKVIKPMVERLLEALEKAGLVESTES